MVLIDFVSDMQAALAIIKWGIIAGIFALAAICYIIIKMIG